MIDPDAPSRDDAVKAPVLHWLVANFQQSNLKDGRTLCKFYSKTFIFKLEVFCYCIDSYHGPAPPAGSGPHRYLFLLYQSIDKIPEKTIESEQRLRYPLQQYVTDNRLGLLDVTYFTVDN